MPSLSSVSQPFHLLSAIWKSKVAKSADGSCLVSEEQLQNIEAASDQTKRGKTFPGQCPNIIFNGGVEVSSSGLKCHASSRI